MKKGAKPFSQFLESVLNSYGKGKAEETSQLKSENEALKKELLGIAGNKDLQKIFEDTKESLVPIKPLPAKRGNRSKEPFGRSKGIR